jgi:hypothetical protein
MAPDLENHTLEILRALRSDVATVKEKVTNIEHHVIQLRIADAKHADDEAHVFRRLRDYDLRLERIEKRLELREN